MIDTDVHSAVTQFPEVVEAVRRLLEALAQE